MSMDERGQGKVSILIPRGKEQQLGRSKRVISGIELVPCPARNAKYCKEAHMDTSTNTNLTKNAFHFSYGATMPI